MTKEEQRKILDRSLRRKRKYCIHGRIWKWGEENLLVRVCLECGKKLDG